MMTGAEVMSHEEKIEKLSAKKRPPEKNTGRSLSASDSDDVIRDASSARQLIRHLLRRPEVTVLVAL